MRRENWKKKPVISQNSNEKIEVYVARKLKAGTQNLDENEYVNVKAYTVDELKEKIFSGEIEDSKTIASVLAYEARYLK